MIDGLSPVSLSPLPLVLWETPPGLELALAQEGVPFVRVREIHPMAFRSGRFVLYDGKRVSAGLVRSMLTGGHAALDIDLFRQGEPVDPFRALIDTEAAPGTWSVEGLTLVERVARYPKARIRRRLIDRIRSAIVEAGGLWARLAIYPFPYRSAFNLRIDLDEPEPEDYARFAKARRPIDDCSTHFVSTAAYGALPEVLDDLRRVDAQSHGHYHFVYRESSANRRNLERAHEILLGAGFHPEGFAGPHGRWNAGIDQVLEDLGYSYSSDFQIGYDDVPFFPWRGDRFSKVLQIPVHPLCEGVFLEAGGEWQSVADHLVRAVRAKVEAGEPAFVYGHPEGRLGRYPRIVSALAEAVDRESMLWRTTLTEFARWWRWRAERTWSVVPRDDERFEIQFDEWDARYPMALEIVRGRHVSTIPLSGPRTPFSVGSLAFERRDRRVDLASPAFRRGSRGLRAAVRSALDWETVTPTEELPSGTLAARVKRELRRWKDREAARPNPVRGGVTED
ncbi:hypothetical protein P12x_001950 [Tundrisphaera lichenicola]|uniref:hypothetical protein n=1 Tax=Tundrisphaera lichenicola TaxID=2029860 RepID=UPI003EB97C30